MRAGTIVLSSHVFLAELRKSANAYFDQRILIFQEIKSTHSQSETRWQAFSWVMRAFGSMRGEPGSLRTG